MSPGAIRLFFAVGLSFLIGNLSGAWVTRALYGGPREEEIEPAPARQRICAPCPDCPLCPTPPPCGAMGAIPTSTAPRAIVLPDDEPTEERKPGLPASAIDLATRKVREEVASCISMQVGGEARGSVLLALTVTATSGQGFISDVTVLERSGDAVSNDELEQCLLDGARRAHFEWAREDGESHARLPIALKKR